jgi:hypothetical protein
MSSAAETRNTNGESASPAEYAAGADHELMSAGATTATEATVTLQGHSEAGVETGDAGPAGGAGAKSGKWRWVAFGAVITAAVMDLLDSTIAQVAAPTIRRELGGSYAGIGAIFFALASGRGGHVPVYLHAAGWTALATVALLACSFVIGFGLPRRAREQ